MFCVQATAAGTCVSDKWVTNSTASISHGKPSVRGALVGLDAIGSSSPTSIKEIRHVCWPCPVGSSYIKELLRYMDSLARLTLRQCMFAYVRDHKPSVAILAQDVARPLPGSVMVAKRHCCFFVVCVIAAFMLQAWEWVHSLVGKPKDVFRHDLTALSMGDGSGMEYLMSLRDTAAFCTASSDQLLSLLEGADLECFTDDTDGGADCIKIRVHHCFLLACVSEGVPRGHAALVECLSACYWRGFRLCQDPLAQVDAASVVSNFLQGYVGIVIPPEQFRNIRCVQGCNTFCDVVRFLLGPDLEVLGLPRLHASLLKKRLLYAAFQGVLVDSVTEGNYSCTMLTRCVPCLGAVYLTQAADLASELFLTKLRQSSLDSVGHCSSELRTTKAELAKAKHSLTKARAELQVAKQQARSTLRVRTRDGLRRKKAYFTAEAVQLHIEFMFAGRLALMRAPECLCAAVRLLLEPSFVEANAVDKFVSATSAARHLHETDLVLMFLVAKKVADARASDTYVGYTLVIDESPFRDWRLQITLASIPQFINDKFWDCAGYRDDIPVAPPLAFMCTVVLVQGKDGYSLVRVLDKQTDEIKLPLNEALCLGVDRGAENKGNAGAVGILRDGIRSTADAPVPTEYAGNPATLDKPCVSHIVWSSIKNLDNLPVSKEVMSERKAIERYIARGITWTSLRALYAQGVDEALARHRDVPVGGPELEAKDGDIVLSQADIDFDPVSGEYSQTFADAFVVGKPPPTVRDRSETNIDFMAWLIRMAYVLRFTVPKDVEAREMKKADPVCARRVVASTVWWARLSILYELAVRALMCHYYCKSEIHYGYITIDLATGLIQTWVERIMDTSLQSLFDAEDFRRKHGRFEVHCIDRSHAHASWVDAVAHKWKCAWMAAELDSYRFTVATELVVYLQDELGPYRQWPLRIAGVFASDLTMAIGIARDAVAVMRAGGHGVQFFTWFSGVCDGLALDQLELFGNQVADAAVRIWRGAGRFKRAFVTIFSSAVACKSSVLDAERKHSQWKIVMEGAHNTSLPTMNAKLNVFTYLRHNDMPSTFEFSMCLSEARAMLRRRYSEALERHVPKSMRPTYVHACRFALSLEEYSASKESKLLAMTADGVVLKIKKVPTDPWTLYLKKLLSRSGVYGTLKADAPPTSIASYLHIGLIDQLFYVTHSTSASGASIAISVGRRIGDNSVVFSEAVGRISLEELWAKIMPPAGIVAPEVGDDADADDGHVELDPTLVDPLRLVCCVAKAPIVPVAEAGAAASGTTFTIEKSMLCEERFWREHLLPAGQLKLERLHCRRGIELLTQLVPPKAAPRVHPRDALETLRSKLIAYHVVGHVFPWQRNHRSDVYKQFVPDAWAAAGDGAICVRAGDREILLRRGSTISFFTEEFVPAYGVIANCVGADGGDGEGSLLVHRLWDANDLNDLSRKGIHKTAGLLMDIPESVTDDPKGLLFDAITVKVTIDHVSGLILVCATVAAAAAQRSKLWEYDHVVFSPKEVQVDSRSNTWRKRMVNTEFVDWYDVEPPVLAPPGAPEPMLALAY